MKEGVADTSRIKNVGGKEIMQGRREMRASRKLREEVKIKRKEWGGKFNDKKAGILVGEASVVV